MAITFLVLADTQCSTTMTAVYSVPSATVARVTEILITNVDTVERTVDISFVGSGGTQGEGSTSAASAQEATSSRCACTTRAGQQSERKRR